MPSDEDVLRGEPEQVEILQPEPQPKGFTEENIDLENLWRDVMEEGEVTSGSFNLIRSWTRLKELRQNTYTVAVSTDFARKHVQEKMDTMDKIMTIILKRPLKGSVIVEKNTENTVKRSEPDYAREVKDALGLDIIVED